MAGKACAPVVLPLIPPILLCWREQYASWNGLQSPDDFYASPAARQAYKDHGAALHEAVHDDAANAPLPQPPGWASGPHPLLPPLLLPQWHSWSTASTPSMVVPTGGEIVEPAAAAGHVPRAAHDVLKKESCFPSGLSRSRPPTTHRGCMPAAMTQPSSPGT